VIVVDTSVWVDFFRGADVPHVATLVALVDRDEDVRLTDLVLTEILQGLSSDGDLARVERRLGFFDILRLETLDDFKRGAALYRTARTSGVTVRKTIDCLIASVCIREGAPVLHNDRDFDVLASCSDLITYPARFRT
jgi:predicted nucleic acid-binding protein